MSNFNRSSANINRSPVEIEEDEGIDFKEMLSIVASNRWLIASFALTGLILALLYAFLAPPVYEANSLIQIQQQQTPLSGDASSSLLSMFLPNAAPTDAEIQIMESRSVLQPVVDKLGLNIGINPRLVPLIWHFFHHIGKSEVDIKKLEVPSNWEDEDLELLIKPNSSYELYSPNGKKVAEGTVGRQAEGLDGKVKIFISHMSLEPGDKITLVRYPDQEVIRDLKKQLSAVEKGQNTGIVNLSLQGTDPRLIREIVNAIDSHYIDQNVAENSSQAQKSLQFVTSQLPGLKKQLDEAQSKLTAYRAKYGVINVDAQTQAMLQEMTNLQADLSQLQLAASEMKQQYTDKFPSYIALEQQEQQIRARISELEGKVSGLPEKEQGYFGLMRNAKVLEQLYTALLSKAQDLKVAKAGTLGSARIVDYAIIPRRPVKPRKALVSVMGLILGLLAGFLAAFIRQTFFRSAADVEDLENNFGLPVLSVIQQSEKHEEALRAFARNKNKERTIPLLAVEEPAGMVVEAIRSLRTSLSFALWDKQRKVVTFSGTAPGVGKSFVTANVACVMADSGSKVLVIDADLRRGHLHRYFQTDNEQGLAEVLEGQVKLGDAIRSSGLDKCNVDFIPTGRYPISPYELVASHAMQNVLDECAEQYDIVLVDVPPVLAVADGIAIARMADANLLVVKAGRQTIQEVRLALKRMERNGGEVFGFVINGLTKRMAAYSQGRYGHAYQYKYDRQ